MHALVIVQQLLRSCCPRIHAARLKVMLSAVAAAVRGRRLVLTELGRALASAARVKHSIKRIDRLLGNRHLALERVEVYQALAHRLVGALTEPLIVIPGQTTFSAGPRFPRSATRFDVGDLDHFLPPRDFALEHFAQALRRTAGGRQAFARHALFHVW